MTILERPIVLTTFLGYDPRHPGHFGLGSGVLEDTLEPKAVRGMHDLFGPEMDRWTQVENRLKKIFADFGYAEIRTPALEHLEVFSHTVGDDTDIVEKQMYQIQQAEGSEKLVLRPEGTAAFMRAVIEHQLHRTGKPQRYFYYMSMFRHERPQKGRLRQFHQFGAEIINDGTAEADAEIIALLHHIYGTFGVTEYEVKINSVGDGTCRPIYKEKLKAFLLPQLSSLCELCQKRFERSPLRVLDCKRESCQAIVKNAPKITESLCDPCRDHHASLKRRLTSLGIPFEEDPSIVRGLDYYSRTAFEFTSNLLGAQSALVGGGRYDGLSTRFGEASFPAVGFGLGVERLMLVLEQKQSLKDETRTPSFYFAALGDAAFETLFPLSFRLKRKGIAVEMGYEPKGLKNLLKQADRSGARYTLILGDTELKDGKAPLKQMKDGTQELIELKQLESELTRRV